MSGLGEVNRPLMMPSETPAASGSGKASAGPPVHGVLGNRDPIGQAGANVAQGHWQRGRLQLVRLLVEQKWRNLNQNLQQKQRQGSQLSRQWLKQTQGTAAKWRWPSIVAGQKV